MNFSRLSLVLVTFGAVSFVLDYYYIDDPLGGALLYFGGLGVFGGGLFACIGFLQRWRTPNARFSFLVDTGWTTLSIGVLVSIGSYLALTQTVCGYPFLVGGIHPPGPCNLDRYYVPLYAGLVLAAAGLGIVVYGKFPKTVASSQKLTR